MSDKLNEVIQDIAIKHGVVLAKNDPVLILQTMNDRLLEENRKAQEELLVKFREEMEGISSQWKDDAKEKAENVINATLAASKEVMAKLLRESTSESVQAMKKIVSDSLIEAKDLTERTWRYCWIAFGSMITLLGCCFFILIFITQ
ncbi:conjugal transfer protein TraM [Legionella spiritensis]|uniref:Conjugal transfer protein TraM n=1 Tax=Legionella spiritensis TaxID=452 RepID=A0A0W0Z6M1_LEGSP|nr:conjugal transfer protein TraM [Legionella spiritensis]KTD64483.1 conjugal transfer protein TraM [Legionella spiritensis]SNV45604.1 conjugal transfer protein TraM [Legionella spiritensis]